MMHVVEHEFAHILHQTIPYPEAFAEITTNYDASSWYNTKEADAYGMGFVSRYARYNDNEDFVETMSLIMVNGLDWFENTVIKGAQGSVDPATPTAGVVALRRKVFILENYLRDSWGIEFFDQGNKKGLVTLVQEAIAEVSQ